MEYLARTISTLGIWAAIMVMTMMATSGLNSDEWVIIPMLLFAMIATRIVWRTEDTARRPMVQVQTEMGQKAKRGENSEEVRLRLLLEMMSDDEREDFKESLKRRMLSGDGELNYNANSIESLLDDDYTPRKRR